jgi:large subunit ribosomal protein L1
MLQCPASYIRQFNTTPSLHISRTKEPKIRTPSKKALAAKARRKAAIAKKEDQRLLKLPLLDAIAVLRVSYSPNFLFAILQQQ